MESNRTETRIITDSFESIDFKHNNKTITAVIKDKSNNGLGCYCSKNCFINVNDVLNVWDILLYKICWIKTISSSIILFGLIVIEDL